LPQGLPKKIQFHLLLADLALQIANAPARRRNSLNPTRRRTISHLAGPTRRPQSLNATPPEMHAPLVELVRTHPKFDRQRFTTLPTQHPLHRRKLELPAENTSLHTGHFSSPKKCSLFNRLNLRVHSTLQALPCMQFPVRVALGDRSPALH
jgi:hypothetical protein